jgi:toxin ParE1/3/4
MNVHWTESALADLEAVEAYISRHSPQYARGMVERIFTSSGQLEDHPRLGMVVPEYEDETIRELFADPYRLVYRVGDGQIDILAVVHAARRLPRGL